MRCTSSATGALLIALRMAGVGPDSEVILPTLTFAACANVVEMLGAAPVFADVDPATGLIDVDCVERLLGPRTRAVLGVHLGGRPLDLDRLNVAARRARGGGDRGRRARDRRGMERAPDRRPRQPLRLLVPRQQEHDHGRGRRACGPGRAQRPARRADAAARADALGMGSARVGGSGRLRARRARLQAHDERRLRRDGHPAAGQARRLDRSSRDAERPLRRVARRAADRARAAAPSRGRDMPTTSMRCESGRRRRAIATA